MPEELVKLVSSAGSLYAPNSAIVDDLQRKYAEGQDVILMFEHPGGDVDTVNWPDPNEDHLRGALYDAREMGQIPDCHYVLLPDGKEFQID